MTLARNQVVDFFLRQNKLAVCIFRCLFVTVLYLFVNLVLVIVDSDFVYQCVCMSLSLYCSLYLHTLGVGL